MPVDVIPGKCKCPGRNRRGDVAQDVKGLFFQRLGKNGQRGLDLPPDEGHEAAGGKGSQEKAFRLLQQEQPGKRRMGRGVHVQAPRRAPCVEFAAPAPHDHLVVAQDGPRWRQADRGGLAAFVRRQENRRPVVAHDGRCVNNEGIEPGQERGQQGWTYPAPRKPPVFLAKEVGIDPFRMEVDDGHFRGVHLYE